MKSAGLVICHWSFVILLVALFPCLWVFLAIRFMQLKGTLGDHLS